MQASANEHDVMKYVHDDYKEKRGKMVEIIKGKFES